MSLASSITLLSDYTSVVVGVPRTVIIVGVREWLQMYEDISHVGELCQQSILDQMTDSMPLGDSEVLIDFDMDIGEELQTSPLHECR